MLTGQVVPPKDVSAIGAHLPVSGKQLGVAQRGGLAPGARRDGAVHRHDRVQLQPRLEACPTLNAAAQNQKRVSQRPGDTVVGIQSRRILG